MNKLYCLNIILSLAYLKGRKEKRIWEPSKGGIGIRLNIAKRKLYIEIILKNKNKEAGKLKNLIGRAKRMPTMILIPGPAKETLSSPHLLSLRLFGLIGTGFAQPKTGPLPKVNINIKIGKSIVLVEQRVDLAVHPDFRGRGIFTSMFNNIKKRSIDLGVKLP